MLAAAAITTAWPTKDMTVLHRCRFVFALLACSLAPCPVLASVASEIAGRVQTPLHAIYEARQFEPLWLDGNTPSPRAGQAIALLEAAGEDGLATSDFPLPQLASQQAAVLDGTADDAARAGFDLLLSQAMARYVEVMMVGRVDPQQLGIDIDTRAERARLPQQLERVLTASDLNAAAQDLRPVLPAYQALRNALPAYRALAGAHPDAPSLPALPGRKLEPGQPWEGTTALANWLGVLGDLPAGTVAPDRYDGPLVDAVKHFQARHGLATDGVIGKQTDDALRISLPRRVQQIELAMERLRWLDDAQLAQRRFILINVPQFTLWAFVPANGSPAAALSMPVVVGEARKTQTPLMAKTLSTLVFRPYWNVPRSIAVKELLPKLRKDPAYLVHEDMEWVDMSGIPRGNTFGPDEKNRLVLGEYRIRQRAGEKNALGRLKFVFPNDDSIYMHDTPAKKLFAKDRRDFSHGCIRLGDPMALALFVLETQGSWDTARVEAMIASSTDQHLPLKERMPVLVFYYTAAAGETGEPLFLPDIYQQDPPLAAALAHAGHTGYQ